MSNDPKNFKDQEIPNPTPQRMREEMDKFFEHVQSHAPETLEFMVMVAGHGTDGPNTHICSMIGGSTDRIATVIVELIDELVKRNPHFGLFFLIHFLQKAHALRGGAVHVVPISTADLSKFDEDGGESAKAKLDELLKQFNISDDKPPEGGLH